MALRQNDVTATLRRAMGANMDLEYVIAAAIVVIGLGLVLYGLWQHFGHYFKK